MRKPKTVEAEKSEFRKRLDVLMVITNTTNEDLAKIIGVTPSSISNYKAVNGRIPSIERLLLMANYFGVTIDFLLGNSGYFEANLGTADNPNRVDFKRKGIMFVEATSNKKLL